MLKLGLVSCCYFLYVTYSYRLALGDRFVYDALHDTQPKDSGCMIGTRESVLTRILGWIKNDSTRMFWLTGMAGTGKTSIAVTICRMLQDDGNILLAGSFFCSRFAGSVPRTDVRRILPTLAASLADRSPEFAEALATGLQADPRVAYKPVSSQLDTLLIQPFSKLSLSKSPIVFVIDALDECANGGELADLLAAIADIESAANVKFILTSRPEMHIRGTSISRPKHSTILHLHTISDVEVTADIRRYINATLGASTQDGTWYQLNDIEELVRLSQGLFIFASTVLLYVQAREHVSGRKERLRKATSATRANSAATVSLDRIYEMIVLEAARSDKVDGDELRAAQRALACILAGRISLSIQALADLLDAEAYAVRGSLERLHSVVYLPDDDTRTGVRVLHTSFGDYIVARAAEHIRISESLGDQVLAVGCLRIMSKSLYFNVSQSHSSHEPNLGPRPHNITLALEYACLQWIYHVAGMPDAAVLDEDIHRVLGAQFLFWLEVMSVLGRVGRAAAMLVFAAATVRQNVTMHL